MSFSVRTKAYSGPFDLLLQLVSRQKVAIGSISIATIADQYLSEVEAMGGFDLEVASDFLLVASTLLDMKAAALVPSDVRTSAVEDEDDELANLSPDELREVLIARLITYKQFRAVAAALAVRMEAESMMEPRTVGPDPEFLGLVPDFLSGISLRSLAVICADLDSRRQSFLLEAEHVAPTRLPIALVVASVDRVTRSRQTVTFSELVGDDPRVETIVATFLALLELSKRGSVMLSQPEAFGEINVAHVEGAAAFEADEHELSVVGEGV